MSHPSESFGGSFWFTLSTSLLHGCATLLLLLLATLLGWIGQIDTAFGQRMSAVMEESFAHHPPAALSWLLAIVIAFGLPVLLLNCRLGWQRWTVWLAGIAVLALWAPVLCLASYRPYFSLVWLAAACSGLSLNLHMRWIARSEGPKNT